MSGTSPLDVQIRSVLQNTVNLSKPVADLTSENNLYDAGLSSFDLVNLLVALETGFNVDFPNCLMQRDTFCSIAAIGATIVQLQQEQSPI